MNVVNFVGDTTQVLIIAVMSSPLKNEGTAVTLKYANISI